MHGTAPSGQKALFVLKGKVVSRWNLGTPRIIDLMLGGIMSCVKMAEGENIFIIWVLFMGFCMASYALKKRYIFYWESFILACASGVRGTWGGPKGEIVSNFPFGLTHEYRLMAQWTFSYLIKRDFLQKTLMKPIFFKHIQALFFFLHRLKKSSQKSFSTRLLFGSKALK